MSRLSLPSSAPLPPPLPLSIAMLTHSINPRGGVVHSLQLSESLQAAGNEVTLFAPDPHGQGLFRRPRCGFTAIPGAQKTDSVADMVGRRIDAYLQHFLRDDTPRYDIYHAQDSISANALATLTERGVIPGFVRTVHHLDQFDDAQLQQWQERGFRQADRLLCVSKLWQDKLRHEHGVAADIVNNGVDLERYQPHAAARDADLREELGLAEGPVFLAVGGVEPRKNTNGILQGFLRVRRVFPSAQLVIAGGASLLDHRRYRQQFDALLLAGGIETGPGKPIMILGQVADADMPSLFRCADALVFPSLKEGFGLVVLEAMACGVPVVVSRIAPFTEYLRGGSCAWVDPEDPASIAAGMAHACDPAVRAQLREAGADICRQFSWPHSAGLHLHIYRAHLAQSREISYA
ncbi:MSMEG_0565 family glycosyltransferase [Herbaspirillum sp. RV1423]|uniref:MSMEG_0565 family glycosyltransferase n=1 Tax=Herbaspirillum sp. RV1423 TaxID=1443993 RepID=UPI0004B8E366|nr:MSMEG_0565 family glycosyltransferase [Herbaspirillum sp. RV1423]